MAAADNSSKAYKEALKQIENLVKKQVALKKSTCFNINITPMIIKAKLSF